MTIKMEGFYYVTGGVRDPKRKSLNRLETDLGNSSELDLEIKDKKWVKLNLDLGLLMTSFIHLGPLNHHVLIYPP